MHNNNKPRSLFLWFIVAIMLSLGNIHPGFSVIRRQILDFATLILAAGHIHWIYQNRRPNQSQKPNRQKLLQSENETGSERQSLKDQL